jgi:hypothetical protein
MRLPKGLTFSPALFELTRQYGPAASVIWGTLWIMGRGSPQEGASLVSCAAKLAMHRCTVWRVVQRLKKSGWVHQHSARRPGILVAVTPKMGCKMQQGGLQKATEKVAECNLHAVNRRS